jgi:AbrB family looped-hinge helix DNA binding protein
LCHTHYVAHERFTTHVGERGRFVLPADVRRRLDLDIGDLLVIDVDDDADVLIVRKATDVARSFSGYLRRAAPRRNLASELIAERRAEAERETAAAAPLARS